MWAAIDVGLPELPYKSSHISGQEKGSTTWAAHSHTPCSVRLWENFDSKIAEAAQLPQNQAQFLVNVEEEMRKVKLEKVSREQHVTNNTTILLRYALEDALPGVEFTQTDEYTIANPDIVALKEETMIISAARAKASATAKKEMENAARLTLETKPFWKFRFLMESTDSTKAIIKLWSIPKGYSSEYMRQQKPLPEEWSPEKRKVFHLIRQLYGQMLSSNLRYGILHLYELWWFCYRDLNGHLFISRSFAKKATSPSVLQAIVTLVSLEDYRLAETVSTHPKSAIKARGSKPRVRKAGSGMKRGAPATGGTQNGQAKKSKQKKPAPTTQRGRNLFEDIDAERDLASLIQVWECDVVAMTEHVKLLTNKHFPSILVKLQRDSSQSHVANEMRREAHIYEELTKSQHTRGAIPQFYGYSDHLGVGILCTERQGQDFEDIGVEKLSNGLKESAVESLLTLSQAGLLHNDVALRNVVRCRDDPNHAKIIDFGRAEFTNDQKLLKEQVIHLRHLLQMDT